MKNFNLKFIFLFLLIFTFSNILAQSKNNNKYKTFRNTIIGTWIVRQEDSSFHRDELVKFTFANAGAFIRKSKVGAAIAQIDSGNFKISGNNTLFITIGKMPPVSLEVIELKSNLIKLEETDSKHLLILIRE